MPDRRAAAIRAAGAVLSRRGEQGDEVALIHRGRYNDWSLPKGKREPGEHVLETAVREVAEETGIRVILGPACSARPGIRASAGPSGSTTGRRGRLTRTPFPASSRTTRSTCWTGLPSRRRASRLSYQRDVSLLAELAGGPAETIPLILLRHASAGSKRAWPGADLDRPLDPGGAADAERLAGLLSCFGSCRVITSAAERCVATVRPYAARTGAVIETEAEFTVPASGGTPAVLRRAAADR